MKNGEKGLYVTLSETRNELLQVAKTHNFDLSEVAIYEMAPSEAVLASEQQLTMFHPSELELTETMKAVLAEVQRIKPQRVVFDSLSEMRLLAQHPLRYRRQILALKQFFAGQNVTLMLLDDGTEPDQDQQLQSIAHGVIHLQHRANEYGTDRRQLRIIKMRGVKFSGGMHDFVIRTGGLDVFTRLDTSHIDGDPYRRELPTGIEGLDNLLCGGIWQGSSTLLLGPAGSGKSTVALQFCVAAAKRGERAALYIFDETPFALRTRASKLGMPLEKYLENGMITLTQVDPAELSPGELASNIRRAVEGADNHGHPAKVIVIDSLNGYLHSMSQEKQMTAQLHELLTYLTQHGVTIMITVSQTGMIGSSVQSPVDTTYLSDNVILFRYFEFNGQMRRAISIVKKRSGDHERTIRELMTGENGVTIGPALEGFQGIFTGTPTFLGKSTLLMDKQGKHGA